MASHKAIRQFKEELVENTYAQIMRETGWTKEAVQEALLTKPVASFIEVTSIDPSDLLHQIEDLKAVNRVISVVASYYGINDLDD